MFNVDSNHGSYDSSNSANSCLRQVRQPPKAPKFYPIKSVIWFPKKNVNYVKWILNPNLYPKNKENKHT